MKKLFNKLYASLLKEFKLLIHDKVALLLLFILPLFLVFVITLVQDSTFRLVNENEIEVYILNADEGDKSLELLKLLKESGNFKVEELVDISKENFGKKIIKNKYLIGIYIPRNFSKSIEENLEKINTEILEGFGFSDSEEENKQQISSTIPKDKIIMYYNPIVQDNFRASIAYSLNMYFQQVESNLILQQIFENMGFDGEPEKLKETLFSMESQLEQIPASNHTEAQIPNSTQHNVPAWSIFAMFFMVVSLGASIVKDKQSGNFVRLKAIPGSIPLTFVAKSILYILVGLLQLSLIFIMGIFIFPKIALPELRLPESLFPLFIVSLLSVFAAISYALLIGTFSKTVEQANGFGAVSIIIFAAIGGIWVPSFVLPDFLQQIGNISPLKWCLESYYILFLQSGSWTSLYSNIITLSLFIISSQVISYYKLKLDHFI